MLDLAQVQQRQRIDDRFTGGHHEKVRARDFLDGPVQRSLAEQEVGNARAAVQPEQRVHDGPPEVEIGQQRRISRQMSLGESEVGRRDRLALRRRGARHNHRMDRLEAFHVIEPGPERAKLLHGSLMRARNVDQQRISRRAERDHLRLFQETGQIWAQLDRRRCCGARVGGDAICRRR